MTAAGPGVQQEALLPLDPSLWTRDEFVGELEAWAEQQAVRAVDGEPNQLEQLAAWAEDRRWAPTAAETQAAPDPWNEPAANIGEGPGAADLPSTREVISTGRRYVLAVIRVEDAFGVLERQLERRLAAVDGWGLEAIRQQERIARRLAAVRRRRGAFRRCCFGDEPWGTYSCTSCTGERRVAMMGCNSRTCPRCAPKLRTQAQAYVLDILELVDSRRQQVGRPAARWRFLTLTLPSSPDFEGMRRFFGRCWSRLLRREFWRSNVGACVATWETTHTRAGWHVHCHSLVDSYLWQPRLVAEWQHACLLELVADAIDRRHYWKGAALKQATVAAARRFARASRQRPLGTPMVQRRRIGDDLQLLEVDSNSLAAALRLVPERERGIVRWQLLKLLEQVPDPAAQYITMPRAGRKGIARELAKYLAKDLAGASSSGEWGPAGQAEHLAELMVGSWRWRTLRTYGDAFNARKVLEEKNGHMTCETCGGEHFEWIGVQWLSPSEAQAFRELHRRRQRKRRLREACVPVLVRGP